MSANDTRRAGARSKSPKPRSLDAAKLSKLADAALLDAVQRKTFEFFWVTADARSGLALDRWSDSDRSRDHVLATGGSGFSMMTLIVAVERGWITRRQALERLTRMLEFLGSIPCYHGALPHFIDSADGAPIPLTRKDDGGDLVETAFLCMGLLCVRQYFDRDSAAEAALRARIQMLWSEVEWSWYTKGTRDTLYWHWSANNGWAMDHPVRGWDECLVVFVLAAGAPRYSVEPSVYRRGYASGPQFRNGQSYYGMELPLGAPYGGPLFFSQYSFCGLDPRGLKDRFADYWVQNVNHSRINHAHCKANPNRYRGMSAQCWGLTASDGPDGYRSHSPEDDDGTITPSAALSSFPYTQAASMQALRHFLSQYGARLWGRFGFFDAFNPTRNWYARTYLSIDQAPIVLMIENFRSALLWRLFMSAPEVLRGLERLGFATPYAARV